MLNIRKAKDTLFSLGSRFHITPEEYDAFFKWHTSEEISDADFSSLIARHEDDLLRQAGIDYQDDGIIMQSLDVEEQPEEE